VIRGRIGVTVTQVPREDYQEFGLKTRSGAIVASVTSGGAAAKAGVEPGDVIVQYNGRPVTSSDELVKMVVGTKPGTSVPVRVLRNKAGENAEPDRRRTGSRGRAAEPRPPFTGSGAAAGRLAGCRAASG
jgi:serine protease Do